MTAQSVQNVLNAAGAALLSPEFEDECEKIYQEFDPPIVCGTYSGVSQARRDDNSENGDNSKSRNQQSEHFVANSSMQGTRGNNSTNIPGAKDYTEGTAFSYNVYDDQSAGTEHKWLTDKAKEWEEGLDHDPTLKERLDEAQKRTEDSLKSDLVRNKDGQPRPRVKQPNSRTKQENDDLAKAAAKCLRMAAEKQFAQQKVSQSTVTRRGLAKKASGAAASTAGAETGRD